MLGKLLGHDTAYIRTHFREFSDKQLAQALGTTQSQVRRIRDRYRLHRGHEDSKRIKQQRVAEPPPYTAQAALPRDTIRLDARCFAAAVAVFLAALAVYLRTLPPTVTGEDSGELIAAAYTLGVAHPPGYPLWTMLGKLFTLIPYGSIAWRVNFMSAFFGVGACALVYMITFAFCRRHVPAMAAGLALAFSFEFWEQAIIAEVYSLNAFLLALCVVLLLRWYEHRNDSLLYAFAFTFGLGLSNHNTMALLGPVFVLFVLSIDPEFWRRWKVYAACTALALITTGLVHLYLPIRALADPPMNWGDPRNWENFRDVVTRAQYSFMFTDDPRTVGRFVRQVWMLGGLHAQQFTPWLAWLPLLGVPVVVRAGWRRSVFVGLAGLCLSMGYILILNTKFEQESMWVATVFYIPLYMIMAVLMGCGIAFGAGLLERSAPLGRVYAPRIAAAAVAGACILLPLYANWEHNDRSQDYWAWDFGINTLATLEENAIYFPSADHATFPVIYLQAVEGMRPDVAIANKYGYPELSLYRDMPESMRAGFSKIPTAPQERQIEDWIIQQYAERPVYFSSKRDMGGLSGYRLVNAGLLYRVLRPSEEPPDMDYWTAYTWRTLRPGDTRGDYTARLILGDVHFAKARTAMDDGDTGEALNQLQLALDAVGRNKETLNNFGSFCAENGLFEDAIGFLQQARDLAPDYDTPLRNLAKVYLQTGHYANALDAASALLGIRTDDAEGLHLSAQAQRRLGRPQAALETLGTMLTVHGDHPMVYREIGMILLEDLRNPREARHFLMNSLRLDPDQTDLQLLVSQLEERGEEHQTDSAPIPGLPSLPGPPRIPIPTPDAHPRAVPPAPRLPQLP